MLGINFYSKEIIESLLCNFGRTLMMYRWQYYKFWSNSKRGNFMKTVKYVFYFTIQVFIYSKISRASWNFENCAVFNKSDGAIKCPSQFIPKTQAVKSINEQEE